ARQRPTMLDGVSLRRMSRWLDFTLDAQGWEDHLSVIGSGLSAEGARVPQPAAVIVLAAGSGTRMKSKTMKVLHQLGGRSMIGHVLAAAQSLEPRNLVAVVGHGREQVGPHILELVPDALLAVQEEQLGTGHAVRVATSALADAGTTS